MKDFKELFNELIEEYPGDESIKWAQQRLKERGLQQSIGMPSAISQELSA